MLDYLLSTCLSKNTVINLEKFKLLIVREKLVKIIIIFRFDFYLEKK